VRGVTIDSRSDCNGLLFVAIKGDRFDGHDFVVGAVEAGATAVMVQDASRYSDLPDHISIVEVEDCHAALGQLAKWWRAQFAIPVIGVTGSAGKTSIKEMLYSIFSQLGNGLATKGNLNNDIGVPLTLLRLKEGDQFAIVEMGMSALGEIEYLTDIAKPTIAVVSNAGAAHLEGVGSLENVARAKGEIFSGLSIGGTAVINQDDKYASYWLGLNKNRSVITFGQAETADVQGSFVLKADSSEIQVSAQQQEFFISLPVPGKHMVSNALAATAIALAANIDPETIVQGLSSFKNIAGRMQFRSVNNVLLIDDSYNANPDSMRSAIDVLMAQDAPRTLVVGDMGELGEYAEGAHLELGKYARDKGVEHLYAVGELSRLTAQGFGDGAHHFSHREAFAECLDSVVWQGAFLFKGSRFMKMDELFLKAVNYLKHNQVGLEAC
jgi:UDP-N-acetylmuramoyl-tripeptide--D-alanyl-D-alanine ligase